MNAADRAADTAEIDAVIREAVADMIRDHTMPPNKDRHGYDYRMGWWDAVTCLDSLVKRRIREALLDVTERGVFGDPQIHYLLTRVIPSGKGGDQ